MSTDFTIKLKGELDTSSKTIDTINKQIQDLSKKIEKLDISSDSKSISLFNKELAGLKAEIANITKEMKPITKGVEESTKEINKAAEATSKVSKYQDLVVGKVKSETELHKVLNGEINKTVELLNLKTVDSEGVMRSYKVQLDAEGKIQGAVQETTKAIEKQYLSQSKIDSYKKFSLDQISKTNQQEMIIENKLGSIKSANRRDEYLILQGLNDRKKEQIGLLQKELVTDKRPEKAKEYERNIHAINRAMNEQNKSINILEAGSTSFFDRVIKKSKEYFVYAIAAMTAQNIGRVLREMVNEVKVLDDSLLELRKVTDLEASSLKQFTKEAYAAGESVAKTGWNQILAQVI